MNHCYKGTLYVRDCPDNLWWNAEKGFCTYQQNSGCIEPVTTVKPPVTMTTTTTTAKPVITPKPEPLKCPSEQISMFPHEDSCSKYFICPGKGQQPLELQCTDKFYFSPEQSQCIPSDLVKCQEAKCPANLKAGEIAYLPHPKDCASYFMCLNQSQLKFSCKNGLKWNSAVNSCDHEAKVKCAA